MAAWDLYVDESGSFDEYWRDRVTNELTDRNMFNIVGGYLIPHENISPQIARDWHNNMCHAFHERFGNTPFDLTHANENHPSHIMDIDHIILRQLFVLKWYADRIKEARGYIVTFEIPKEDSRDFGGNTENYLTIISRGIVRLYNDLVDRINDNAPEVYLHIASRRNMDEGEDGVIREYQYKVKIREIVTSYAPWLAEDEFFITIIEKPNHFEIIANGQDERIIPCDFICNTYWREDENEKWHDIIYKVPRFKLIFSGVFSGENRIQFTTTEMTVLDEPYFKNMERSRNYTQVLFRLLQEGYKVNPLTEKFFDRINQIDIIDQRLFARHVSEHYDLFVRNYTKLSVKNANIVEYELTGMLSILKRNDGIDRLKNAEIANLLRARVLLHLFHIHIHQGNEQKTWKRARELAEVLDGLPDGEDKAEIKLRFFNRKIVALTDAFRYDEATTAFTALENYWEIHLAAQNSFLALPIIETGEPGTKPEPPEDAKPMSTERGEEIGSYIQIFTHKLRTMDTGEKQKSYEHLKAYFGPYLKSFSDEGQWKRSYQNLCDLEAEMGHYDIAFAYIARYVDGTSPFERNVPIENNSIDSSETINPENCGRIVNSIKPTDKTGWEFEHFLRLGAEIAYAVNQASEDDNTKRKGKTMYKAICDHIGVTETEKGLEAIEQSYLKAISLRCFARMIDIFTDSNITARRLYQKASEVIAHGMGNSLIFKVIYVSITLEWAAYLMKMQNLQKAKDIIGQVQSTLSDIKVGFNNDTALGMNPFQDNTDQVVDEVMDYLNRLATIEENGDVCKNERKAKLREMAGKLMEEARRVPY